MKKSLLTHAWTSLLEPVYITKTEIRDFLFHFISVQGERWKRITLSSSMLGFEFTTNKKKRKGKFKLFHTQSAKPTEWSVRKSMLIRKIPGMMRKEGTTLLREVLPAPKTVSLFIFFKEYCRTKQLYLLFPIYEARVYPQCCIASRFHLAFKSRTLIFCCNSSKQSHKWSIDK